MTDPQVPYSESRTGRGDKWYQTIGQLKKKADALELYAQAHQAFSGTIEEWGKSLPQDDLRDIARAELVQFIAGRIKDAQSRRVRVLKQIQGMEEQGVPD